MTKFEFIRKNNKKEGMISKAINNIKDELLNGSGNFQYLLERQVKKSALDLNLLKKKTLKAIKDDNGGVLPEYLEKYMDSND